MLTVFVLLLVVFQVVLPYIVAPLLVWFVHKQSANTQISQVSDEHFTPDVRAFFRSVSDCLASQGFRPAAYLRRVNPASRTFADILVLTNESTKESAAAVEMRIAGRRAHAPQRLLEFCTEFVSGEEINTHNCGIAFVTKPHPLKMQFRLPAVRHPLTLYAAHRRLVERHAPASARFIPTPGTEHLHMAHSEEKTHRRQVEFGYSYLDASAGVYRPTLKGACLMAWKLAWPVKQVREGLARRAAAETMRGLGR
jgi:hypothetical protein